MITIKRIDSRETLAIRHLVLWPDKPIEHVMLKEDDQGIHYGLFDDDTLKSVISVFITGDIARFRKFATIKLDQGKGYGSRLFQYMLDDLDSMRISRVWCDARVDALTFYKKFGFTEATGQVFYKGDVTYKVMEKLSP